LKTRLENEEVSICSIMLAMALKSSKKKIHLPFDAGILNYEHFRYEQFEL